METFWCHYQWRGFNIQYKRCVKYVNMQLMYIYLDSKDINRNIKIMIRFILQYPMFKKSKEG